MSDATRAATEALTAHATGDPDGAAVLMPLVYDDLKALAARYMRTERPDHTLPPAALVHEAYLRLVDNSQIDWQGKTHFFALAALQMRRVLVDYARSRQAKKRSGTRVTLDEAIVPESGNSIDLLALDEALDRLALHSERQGKIVELRFFGGLSVKETAFALGISQTTVKEQWRLARARLRRGLSNLGGGS